MADLVADDRADRPEVHGVIGLRVEEGRLEDRRGEDDLVERGVVVGVDRLRRHEPFLAVDGFVQAGELALRLEGAGRCDDVDECLGAAEIEAGHVAPLRRVADLGPEGRELGQGLGLGLLPHPRALADGAVVGGEELRDEGVHALLRLGREVAGHPDPAEGFAREGLDESEGALPARAELAGARQGAPVEVEVLLDEGGGEQGGPRVEERCLEEQGAFGFGRVGPDRGGRGEEVGLVDVDEGGGRDAESCGGGPGVPVESGRERDELAPGHLIVGEQRVPVGHRVAVMGGEAGLQGHEGACGSRRIRSESGECEEALEVDGVGLADVGVVVFAVVGLVGQADAGLDEGEHPDVRIVGVGADVGAEEGTRALGHEAAAERIEFAVPGGGVDEVEGGAQRV